MVYVFSLDISYSFQVFVEVQLLNLVNYLFVSQNK